MSVYHVLAECPVLAMTRQRIPNEILKKMLAERPGENYSIQPVVDFLKHLNMYYNI